MKTARRHRKTWEPGITDSASPDLVRPELGFLVGELACVLVAPAFAEEFAHGGLVEWTFLKLLCSMCKLAPVAFLAVACLLEEQAQPCLAQVIL